MDRALDDLMAMASGCTFTLPVENFDSRPNEIPARLGIEDLEQVVSLLKENGVDTEEKSNLYLNSQPTEEIDYGKNDDSENDVIVLGEEEYCVPAESDSEDEQVTCNTPEIEAADTVNTVGKTTYSTMTEKPLSENVTHAKPPDILFSAYTSYDRIKRNRDSVERVKMYVDNSFKVMVILRGCPGSGKSTLAKNIIEYCGITGNPYWYVHSADNYFCLNSKGEYRFVSDKLPEAHNWNYANILHVVREGLTPVIVDNSNIKLWYMQPFVVMAVCAGYEIEVIEPANPWSFSAKKLTQKNLHNVSEEQIRIKLNSYDHNVSASSLMKTFNLDYAPGYRPPQIGVKTLSNPQLITVFQNIRDALCVLPRQQTKCKSSSKKEQKKERKILKKLGKQKASEHLNKNELEVVEKLKESLELNSESNSSSKSSLTTNEVVYVSSNTSEKSTESDESWSTIDEDESEDKEGNEDVNKVSFSTDDAVKYDAFNVNDEKKSRQSRFSSPEIKEVSNQSLDEAEVLVNDNAIFEEQKCCESAIDHEIENGEDNVTHDCSSTDSVNIMVGRLKNPMNLGANEASVELLEPNQFSFSNQLYDALSKDTPRLKCFEMFHDDQVMHKTELTEKATVAISEKKVPLSPVCNSMFSETKIHKMFNNNAWDVSSDLLSRNDSSMKLIQPSIPPVDPVSMNEKVICGIDTRINNDSQVDISNQLTLDPKSNIKLDDKSSSNEEFAVLTEKNITTISSPVNFVDSLLENLGDFQLENREYTCLYYK